jgi:lipoprotein signal peptidase
LGLNIWNTSHNQHIFLGFNFANLAIYVGEMMKKIMQTQGKKKEKKKLG